MFGSAFIASRAFSCGSCELLLVVDWLLAGWSTLPVLFELRWSCRLTVPANWLMTSPALFLKTGKETRSFKDVMNCLFFNLLEDNLYNR